MASTRNDLVDYVLQKIFVLEGNETPESEDLATGLNIVNSRVAYLRETENIYWDDDAIPDSVKDPLAEYLTHYFIPAFSPASLNDFAQRSMIGLRELQGLLAVVSDNTPITVDYF